MVDPVYAKPFLNFSEQLDLLERRGLTIANHANAEENLQRIGYYRLSGYWYSFRQLIEDSKSERRHDTFNPEYSFEHAVSLYTFDRQLRFLIMDAIERIEVGVRVRVAFEVGKLGAFAHLDTSKLGPGSSRSSTADASLTCHEAFCAKLETAVTGSSEVFAKHYREKYQKHTYRFGWRSSCGTLGCSRASIRC